MTQTHDGLMRTAELEMARAQTYDYLASAASRTDASRGDVLREKALEHRIRALEIYEQIKKGQTR